MANDDGSRYGAERSSAIEVTREDVDQTLAPEGERWRFDVEWRDCKEIRVRRRGAPRDDERHERRHDRDRGGDDNCRAPPATQPTLPRHPTEGMRELGASREALLAQGRERPHHDDSELARHMARERVEARHGSFGKRCRWFVAGHDERLLAGDHLVQDTAERVDVAPAVD